MRIYDIINKKRYGKELTKNEIDFFINGYVNGKIKDYQASALLMAICINSMTDDEVMYMTDAMKNSGDIIKFDRVNGNIVDKHSTGGVGDKTTLVVVPIVAAAGVKIAKMSGRGLGHTGGTIDKLESISGFNIELSEDEFIDALNDVGTAIVGQNKNLVPADKKLYALRDVTATVESIPLIATSIMSKKLAVSTKGIVLEVTVGSGAFMKNIEDARKLAKTMIDIGKHFGREVIAYITEMDRPLGITVGNSLEVIEAINILRGKGRKDVTNFCIELAAGMISVANDEDLDKARNLASKMLNSGKAYEKFKEIVSNQGGDIECIDDMSFEKAKYSKEIFADNDGYISKLDAAIIGEISVVLGAGRQKKEDSIDMTAGIVIDKHYGDCVKVGDRIMKLYSNSEILEVDELIRDAYEISNIKPKVQEIIYEIIR